MKAVQVVAFGSAAEVVKLNEVPDVGGPGSDEVVVAVEATPINNTDLMIIAGGTDICRRCRPPSESRALDGSSLLDRR